MKKTNACYYIETYTDVRPNFYEVSNVERAAMRCGVSLECIEEAFRNLPDGATISMTWRPEDEGAVEELIYEFSQTEVDEK